MLEADVIQCLEDRAFSKLPALVVGAAPDDVDNAGFEILTRLLLAADEHRDLCILDAAVAFAGTLSPKERTLCITATFHRLRSPRLVVAVLKILVDDLPLLNEKVKSEVDENVVDTSCRVLEQASSAISDQSENDSEETICGTAENRTEVYLNDDGFIASFATTLVDLLCALSATDDDSERRLLLALIRRSPSSTPIRTALLYGLKRLSGCRSDDATVSLPVSKKWLPLYAATMQSLPASECLPWPGVYSTKFLLEASADAAATLLASGLTPAVFEAILRAYAKLLTCLDDRILERTEIHLYMDLLDALLKAAEAAPSESARLIALKLFPSVVGKFTPTAQYLVLRRLFTKKKNGGDHHAVQREPQVLAWLVDQYRGRMCSSDAAFAVFRRELSFFYGELVDLRYENIALSYPFYVAVANLIRSHALARFDVDLLRIARAKILDSFLEQLKCFQRLKQVDNGSANDGELQVLDFVIFSITDTVVRVDELLKETK